MLSTILASRDLRPPEPEELSCSLLGHKKTQQCLDLCNCNVLMKTERIQTDTADTDTDNFSFSDRIWIRTVYFLSNNDIHHIWIIEIQHWISEY
jgi:hypothetical protein